MYIVSTIIEIAAPPAQVREKFLAFSNLPNYHPNGFFKSLGPSDPNKPNLEPGDQMTNVLQFGTIKPIVQENSPTRFAWLGIGLGGAFTGEHRFSFESSSTTPGATTFTQEERFTGSLSFLMGSGFVARMVGFRESTEKGFESFNQDLKAWCEKQ